MGFLKSSIKSVGTLLLADFLFYGVAQSATPIFYERIDYMKKIRSYTSIWSVEKVLYSINDFRLPFPITFTQMTWFVVSLFAVMILGNLPPLSMIEGAFLKYFGIPVAFTWFMSTKTFDGKKPYGFLKSVIAYALRPKLTYDKIDQQTDALISMIGENQVNYRFFIGFKLLLNDQEFSMKSLTVEAKNALSDFVYDVNHKLMGDFVSMSNDEILRFQKMEKLLENKISRRFKIRRLDKDDFGYLIEHLYGQTGTAYEEYEYHLSKELYALSFKDCKA